MSLEALIFDVDGTLADTEEAHRTAFNRAFETHRLGWAWTPEDYRRLLGVTGGKERIAAHLDTLTLSAAERASLRQAIGAIHATKTLFYNDIVAAREVPLRPGVQRLIEEAASAGCKLAIASTTSPANVDALLEATLGRHGIDLFSVIACGDSVRAKKPSPEVYELALRTLELRPEHVVAFEDSANGLAAALGAELWTVVTPTRWTEGSDFSGAGLLLDHLGDPGLPIPGEPGGRLTDAAWLDLATLSRFVRERTQA